MKRLMWFAQEVLKDLGTWCDTSTTRDVQTVTRRYEHEGVEFLTLTLPEYGKAFERSLAHSQFDPNLSRSFHYSGHLPVFLQGFVDQVFDRETGALLQDPSVVAIWAIRQFTLMFAKMVPPLNRAKDRAAIDKFMECEQDVHETNKASGHFDSGQFARIGALLWARVLTDVERKVLAIPSEIVPKHGPGATADKLRGNGKWRQTEWPERLEHVFPVTEHLISSWRSLPDLADVQFLEPGAERPVKVITVPKTYKTPRIIAIEPTCMQYMQQGLLSAFVAAVQADDFARQLIGWSSSVPNNHLAWKGSRDGSLATLDLSEASDRVSYQHVQVLLANHPHLFEAVDACRSRKADVLGHGVIHLAKFASMGSALTFPMESMVFMTVVFQGIENALKAQLSRKTVKSFLGRVRVYGDDIIVPTDYVSSVVAALEAHGLKVNAHKSFWTGKFRESCGKEYYDGTDVSIVRVRRGIPTDRQHGEEILSWIALRNQLYFAGLWKATSWVDGLLEGLIPMPVVLPTSPIQGRHSFLGYETQKMSTLTHGPLVRGVVVKNSIPDSHLDGSAALLKILTSKHTQLKEVEHETFFGGGHGNVSDQDRRPEGIRESANRTGARVGEHPNSNQPERRSADLDNAGRAVTDSGEQPPWSMGLVDHATEGGSLPLDVTDYQVGGERLEDVFLALLHGRSPTVDVKHLHRAGRPRRVSIRLRWGQPW